MAHVSWLANDDKDPPNPKVVQLNDGAYWVPGARLGKGGGGTATLWKAVDRRTERVIHRLVVKDMIVTPGNHVIQKGPGAGHLQEAWIQERLQPDDDTADSSIAKTHACESSSKDKTKWRIYMDYYPHGTAKQLVDANVGTVLINGKHENIAWPMPEPFVWYFFRRLALAAVAMDTRLRTGERANVVVHLDLKADNILFAGPGSLGKDKDFPAYPPAYVADFGLAQITYHGDPRARRYTKFGTHKWYAPESLAPDFGAKAAVNVPVHSWTNIWQIGRLVFCLMEGDMRLDQIDFFDDDVDKVPDFEEENFDHSTWKGFSKDLQALVRQCLAYKPDKRPTPEGLLKRIDELMPRYENAMRRWGTSEWFEKQHEEDEPEGDYTYKPVGIGGPTGVTASETAGGSAGTKRKRTGDDEERDAKRVQVPSARDMVTKRRQKLVAQQIKLGRRLEGPMDCDDNDQNFVLPDELKLGFDKADPLFDINAYFTGVAAASVSGLKFPSDKGKGKETPGFITISSSSSNVSPGHIIISDDEDSLDKKPLGPAGKLAAAKAALKFVKKASKTTKTSVKSAVKKATSVFKSSKKKDGLLPLISLDSSSLVKAMKTTSIVDLVTPSPAFRNTFLPPSGVVAEAARLTAVDEAEEEEAEQVIDFEILDDDLD